MSKTEQRLQDLGIILPQPVQLPPGVVFPFPWVRIVGTRALISGHGPINPDGSLAQPLGKVGLDVSLEQGHGPINPDGSLAQPLGKVGLDVSLEQAYVAARLTGLAILSSLQRELGTLDRIATWTRIFGMVNSAAGFNQQPSVINGFTDLIIEVFGAEVGAHARSAVGLAELPFNIPVEIEGEVELHPNDA
ncbi:RidA family protein [Phormidium tenue FACHB-886]|nr:RidA family protein [Phormidium tenue FACHB-886]